MFRFGAMTGRKSSDSSVSRLLRLRCDRSIEVKTIAHYATQRPGGSGAVREAVELILRAQGRWEEAVQKHLGM